MFSYSKNVIDFGYKSIRINKTRLFTTVNFALFTFAVAQCNL